MNPNEAVEKIVTILKPLVAKVEASPASTKNHYGDYMAMIGQAPVEQRKVFAACLIKAGANETGVADALRLSI